MAEVGVEKKNGVGFCDVVGVGIPNATLVAEEADAVVARPVTPKVGTPNRNVGVTEAPNDAVVGGGGAAVAKFNAEGGC